MNLKTRISNLFKLLFPATKQEAIVLLLFFLAYSTLAWFIASNYRIVYDDRIPWDGYFSFDNRAIVTTGGGFERHPLANYFFGWIQDFALLFSDGKKDEVFRIVLALLSAFTISLTVVQILKYLKQIIGLPNKIIYPLLILFGFFTTNILLSFTPENYTYTLLFLCIFNFYVAKKMKEDKMPSTLGIGVAAVAVGGLTITNIVKIYIPLIFEKGLFWNWRKIGSAFMKFGVSVIVFLLLFLYRLDFQFLNFINKTGEQYEKFSKPKVTPIWDMVYSWFFGGNLLFPSFVVRDYHNKKGFDYKAIFMDTYSHWLPYLIVGLIVGFVLWSFIKNFKNALVQILFWSFAVDVIIHCILKFGLHTSYIYGGHFVFVYPLLIGWLFAAYKDSPKILNALYVLLLLVTSYVVVNNLLRFTEFVDFLDLYYI